MDVSIFDLTKTFGKVRANEQIRLHFAAGQIHGVLGENGAGKSTLMKLLAGFLRPDAGEIWLDGQPVKLLNPAIALRVGIGMVAQEPLVIPAFTALENFYCASPASAMPNLASARQRLLNYAEQFGFTIQPDLPVANLTVGQRQQLEILRLLALGAKLLILDEPTTGISALQKKALFEALRKLAAEGKTILFVSHKLEEVAEICTTVSILRAGRVAGEGQMIMPQPQDHLLSLMFGQEIQTKNPSLPQKSETSSAQSVWKLDSVTLREGSRSLPNLNLDIPAGTILGLAGLEGEGQQLFLRLLAGRLRPKTGQFWLKDVEMTNSAPKAFREAGIHYVPADRLAEGLVGKFSLVEHLSLLSKMPGLLINLRSAQAQAGAAIATYAIKAAPTTPLAALSGGNQQRAMLALIPAHCTGLLFDQPTRGLDILSARAVWQQLLARKAAGTAIVFASVDLDELLKYSDSILVFHGGRVSKALDRTDLSATQLAELIGGVGFVAGE